MLFEITPLPEVCGVDERKTGEGMRQPLGTKSATCDSQLGPAGVCACALGSVGAQPRRAFAYCLQLLLHHTAELSGYRHCIAHKA